MSETRQTLCCSQPQALVVIEVIPLCQVGALDPLSVGSSDRPVREDALPYVPAEELSTRCAACLPCADALALVQEVGHVVF